MRNYIVTQIKHEKERYFKEMIDDNNKNSIVMWKKLKLLLPGRQHTTPDEIKFKHQSKNLINILLQVLMTL